MRFKREQESEGRVARKLQTCIVWKFWWTRWGFFLWWYERL